MASFKDHEEHNAAQWETESVISMATNTTESLQATAQNPSIPGPLIDLASEFPSTATGSRPQTGLPKRGRGSQASQILGQGRWNSSNRANSSRGQLQTRYSDRRGNSNYQSNRRGATGSPSSSDTTQINTASLRARENGMHIGRARGVGSGRHIIRGPRGRGFRGSIDGRSARGGWADPAPLITTNRAKQNEAIAEQQAEQNVYLNQGDNEGEFPVNGFYLWPDYNLRPHLMFGSKLEQLDHIRTIRKVWIKWSEQTRCLKISSKSIQHGDETIKAVFEDIRHELKDVKARDIRAMVLILVRPPLAASMTSSICPRSIQRNPDVASDFVFTGNTLTVDEKKAWDEAIRPQKIKKNYEGQEQYLTKYLMAIAPMKGLMRMRVHFARLEIKIFPDDLAKGMFSFEQFDAMLHNSRTETSLNKHLGDAMLAVKLIEKIRSIPGTFSSVNGKYRKLEDIQWKDTEVLLAKVSGSDKPIRIEADIEHMYELDGYEFQPGPVNVFGDGRDIIMEVRNIDVEKKLDWSLEVVSDKCLKELPHGVKKIISDSISVKTKVATDYLGLEYPRVTPRSTQDIQIISTMLRSVIQFQLRASGYVVEIAVYRTWDRADTRGEPTLNVGMTMFHQEWDKQMNSIEKLLEVREWKEDLSTFFAANDSYKSGLEYFITEVEKVQDIVVDVERELNSVF